MIWRVLRHITVEPVLLFYMLGINLLFSVFHNMVSGRICTTQFDLSICTNLTDPNNAFQLSTVQSEASHVVRISTMLMVIPSILVDCYLGSWSDLFGRKVTLVLPALGSFLGTAVYAAIAMTPTMSVKWVYLSSSLMGIFGSYTSLLTGVLAYIGALTPPEERTSRFAILLSMTSIAGTVGPFLGGYFRNHFSMASVFALKAVCHLSAILYTVFILQAPSPLRKPNFSQAISLSHLKDSFRTVHGQRTRQEKTKLALLAVMAMVIMITTSGEFDILYLFVTDTPIGLSHEQFTYYLTAVFGTGGAMMLFGLPLIKYLTKASDRLICFMGLISKICALTLLAFSVNMSMVFSCVGVGCLASFSLTAVRAMMSLCVKENEQGKLLGLFAVLEDCSSLFGTLIFNSLYPIARRVFSEGLKGGVMLLGAAGALLLVALMLSCVKSQAHGESKRSEDLEHEGRSNEAYESSQEDNNSI